MVSLPRIQGHIPDSINEVNVAIALDELDYEYEFQYQLGLYGTSGSQVIDFLVYTMPIPTPLFVHGRYWHGTKQQAEDQLKFAEIISQTHGKWFDPVIIWDDESETVEDAKSVLRKILL
jgi:hypothetical protein